MHIIIHSHKRHQKLTQQAFPIVDLLRRFPSSAKLKLGLVQDGLGRDGRRWWRHSWLPLLVALVATLSIFGTGAQAQSNAELRPTNLTAAIVEGEGVAINWDAPAGDAESVTGYQVLRRRPLSGERTLLVYVADTGSTAITYTDSDATVPGERYVYRVIALRGSEQSIRSKFVRVDIPESTVLKPTPDRIIELAPTPESTTTRASAPEVLVAAANEAVTEGSTAAFIVSLGAAASEMLTVSISVAESGSAVLGPPPVSVVFDAGETKATLSVPTDADQVVEADSAVTATLMPGTGYTIGQEASATVTVENDDVATFSVSTSRQVITEHYLGMQQWEEESALTVAISNGVTFAEDQVITLAFLGTASFKDDYNVYSPNKKDDFSVNPATLHLASGASSATVEMWVYEDAAEEVDETVTVEASHRGLPVGTATLTILNVSHDADLVKLSVPSARIGRFNPAVTLYTGAVVNYFESVPVTVETKTKHPAATVSISVAVGEHLPVYSNPVQLPPGANEVQLEEGWNTVVITVAAEDRYTTKPYTVNIQHRVWPLVVVAGSPTEYGQYMDGMMHGIATHRGEGTVFVVQMHFSELVDISAERFGDHVLQLLNGEVRQVLRLPLEHGGGEVLRYTYWIEIAPLSDNPVYYGVLPTTDCAAIDAVCTSYGKPLSEGHVRTLFGPPPPVPDEPEEEPIFSMSFEQDWVNEGDNATLTAEITNGVVIKTDKRFEMSLSGSVDGWDIQMPHSFVIPAGKSSASVELHVIDDGDVEEPETMTITVTHGVVGPDTGPSIGSDTVTIFTDRTTTLERLSLTGIDIGEFSKRVKVYNASVEHAVETTTVTAMSTHPAATVSIVSGAEVNLEVGRNDIAVKVTAPNGKKKRTYKVVVWRAPPPMTSSFVSLPEQHSGAGITELQIQFNRPLRTSSADMLEQVLDVTNGEVRAARRVVGTVEMWDIEIEPLSYAEMVVVLPVPADCQAPEAVCTEDDHPLTTRLEAVIPGPPVWTGVLSVGADETAMPQVLGFSEWVNMGELSPSRFEVDNESYTVVALFELNDGLSVAVSRELPWDFVLQVGEVTYASSQSLVPVLRAHGRYWWPLGALEWDEDETVAASIRIESMGVPASRPPKRPSGYFSHTSRVHDGQEAFTMRLNFDEADLLVSAAMLRDHALQVSGGSIVAVNPAGSDNRRWDITLQPAGSGDVTVTLPTPIDCADPGAVCSADGRALLGGIIATIAGPAGLSN